MLNNKRTSTGLALGVGAVIVTLDVGLVYCGKAYPYSANHILHGTAFAAPAVSEVGLSVLDTICLTDEDGSRRPLVMRVLAYLFMDTYIQRASWSPNTSTTGHDCAAEKEPSYPHQFEEGKWFTSLRLWRSLHERSKHQKRVVQLGPARFSGRLYIRSQGFHRTYASNRT
ncbi:uncharacterized protein FFMR_05463 [Fusarium fujikuroi]|nr:uncharacterized protein FFMR_05463 [Fusarium fujikuroi]